MYTRTYGEEQRGIQIPDSYGGTALVGGMAPKTDGGDSEASGQWEESEAETSASPSEPEKKASTPLLPKIQLPSFLSNIFKNSNFGLQKIGKEEILLISSALFLFFSKEGDRECAIMLILLLFLG
jgi:hypothetical protein